MATKLCPRSSRALTLLQGKPLGSARALSLSATRQINLPKDAPNMRHAPRTPPGPLKAPIVNPTDKYQSKADDLHRYGTWVMGCLPKYVQQFSVWKDELTIYISPSGVIPVFTFLKCKGANWRPIGRERVFSNSRQITRPPSSPR
jgi:NADH dehydrogenase (ubiquinone) Fe-S protein 3